MKYRREIDGLRAVAVVPVILFHAGFRTFSGGFVGVDVFFVVSGYLITSIIAGELEEGRFSLVGFYERRARRILPALFLVVSVTFALGLHYLLPSDMKDLSQSIAATAAFSSNILFWKESGYFNTAAELKPLLHTWSLGVEEQFYLAFPLILAATWKLARRGLIPLLAIACAASLVISQVGLSIDQSAIFFLLPGRAWELGIGAMTACLLRGHPSFQIPDRTRDLLAALGLLLIVYPIFAFDERTPFPGVHALGPVIGTAMVIAFADLSTRTGRLLALPAFVGVGLISYSAYLWHQPLFAFARHASLEPPGTATYLVLALISMALAYLSWRFVEAPFRRRGVLPRHAVFRFAGFASALMLAVGITGHLTGGYFFRHGYTERMAAVEGALKVNFGLNAACDAPFTDDPRCRTSDAPEVLLWGDSYAMQWAPGLLASRPGVGMVQATMSMCGPVLGAATFDSKHGSGWGRSCIRSNDAVMEYVRSTPSLRYVVLGSIFSQYTGQNNELLLRDDSIVPADEGGRALLVATLRQLSDAGLTPVIIAPMPRDGRDIGKCLGRATLMRMDPAPCDVNLAESRRQHGEIERMLNGVQGLAQVIRPSTALCNFDRCKAAIDGIFIYRDSGHVSIHGSALLGKRMDLYSMLSRSAANTHSAPWPDATDRETNSSR